MKNVIGRGAEALLYLERGMLVKERIAKGYRHPEIDKELRLQRTRREGKLMKKLDGLVPVVHDVDDKKMIITMEYIDGRLLRDVLDELPRQRREELMKELGRIVGEFHQRDVIHGDLTTSNIILRGDKAVFIDFGLGFVSLKAEDKAVDLHVFHEALESKHYTHAEECYPLFLEGYSHWQGSSEVLKRLEKVEQRGRYKRKTKGGEQPLCLFHIGLTV